MRTIKFQTEPFTCPTCATSIESVMGKRDGVDSVQVMFSSNKVKVGFDESTITAEEIAKTITDLGYRVLTQK